MFLILRSLLYVCATCQVFGDKDPDGFYRGESGGLSGYVASNLVAEVPVDDHYLKHLLMRQGFIPVDQTGIRFCPTEHSEWSLGANVNARARLSGTRVTRASFFFLTAPSSGLEC